VVAEVSYLLNGIPRDGSGYRCIGRLPPHPGFTTTVRAEGDPLPFASRLNTALAGSIVNRLNVFRPTSQIQISAPDR